MSTVNTPNRRTATSLHPITLCQENPQSSGSPSSHYAHKPSRPHQSRDQRLKVNQTPPNCQPHPHMIFFTNDQFETHLPPLSLDRFSPVCRLHYQPRHHRPNRHPRYRIRITFLPPALYPSQSAAIRQRHTYRPWRPNYLTQGRAQTHPHLSRRRGHHCHLF